MNIRILKSVAAGSVLALGLVSGAANAATADGTARATILQQVTVTNTSDLQFGTVAIGTGGGAVTVATGGGRTCATTLVCSGATTSAGFSVSGATGMNVGISVPGSVTLTETGGATMSATLASSATSLTLLGTAADAFRVGGTLNVGGTQAAGAYAGTFTVTVNYQ
jgi:hypothetical protein